MLMRGRLLLIFLFLFSIPFTETFSQEASAEAVLTDSVKILTQNSDDTLKREAIRMSCGQAIQFLQGNYEKRITEPLSEPLRYAIKHLVSEAENPPFDSTRIFLGNFIRDTVRVTRIETPGSGGKPAPPPADSLPETDSLAGKTGRDSLIYRYLTVRNDSVKAAVKVLLDYLEVRDSSLISFRGAEGTTSSLWFNSSGRRMVRFWLKNDLHDSVTVWIGNPARDTIGLYLEHGVTFRRPPRQGNIGQASINVEPQDNTSLVNIGRILTKSQYWRNRTETSFSLNQGMLSNWVKGGESNISTALDITWYADYNNKPKLTSSNNYVRLKYGLIKSGDEKIKKNIDLFETNSKLNHKAFGKFDFSAIMLFKTQISNGYNYPNDTDPVSKFFNPAILTLGMGLDYKPNKTTSFNLSPLSYKATFVPDTGRIDQTKYGIAEDRRSKHEPGASFQFTSEFKPFKTVSVTNRLQLFTNYINNPLNIDVDWEMILKASLNWFTELRLNTHLIFDDDTKTVVLDKDKNPVLDTSGAEKKTARIQFKELMGLSFIFRF
jgi:hypothetical protein